MATAATSLLGLALPVTGELSGTWGDTVNNSLTSLLDTAVAGTTTLSSDADVTLTTTTLAANQARQAIILWTAGGTVTRNITAPAQSKAYVVINKTSSTQSIVLRGAGPTTGVTIIAGEECLVAWNGVDFVKVASNSSFDAPVVIEGTTTSAALRITQLGSGNALLVEDSSNPDSTPVAIDASGNVLVGITTAQTIEGITPSYQQLGSGNYAGMWLGRYSANATANYIYLSKSRGTTAGSNTVVSSGDDLGTLAFYGADGTNLIVAATILGEVDGTPGTNDMPGRLLFSTTADGASTATERVRIDSSGNVGIGTSSGSARLNVNGGTSTSQIRWEVNNAAFVNEVSTNAAVNAYVYKSNDASYHVWKISNSEAMRITSAGGVSFGATGTGYGTSGQVLTSAGNAPPTWETPSGAYIGNRGEVFTSTGTFTVPTGVTAAKVTVIGGGGNGGAATGTGSASGGGGGGGVAVEYVTGLTPGGTVTVTVGGVAGTSSFGAFCSATGGATAAAVTTTAAGAGGAGGAGTGGSLNISGSAGSAGVFHTSGCVTSKFGGCGGGSAGNAAISPSAYGGYGVIGQGFISGAGGANAVSDAAGGAASGYGNGGGGAFASSATDRAGGAGTAGIVIVEW